MSKVTHISKPSAKSQSVFYPPKRLSFQVNHARKSVVHQLLDNPPVQITLPADIASNHEVLDLVQKAATTTFKTLNEHYDNAFQNGIITALRMGIFFHFKVV
jgi:hypothetical protein